jgi:hypothetical protein
MSYQQIPMRCACGEAPFRIEEVGLSAERELVIHWWCEPCRKVTYATFPLTRLQESCPAPDHELAEADASFLASLGIRA